MLTQMFTKQKKMTLTKLKVCFYQGLPVLTVGTSMAVTFTHVFLWGSSATNHIENALMGSPWFLLSNLTKNVKILYNFSIKIHILNYISNVFSCSPKLTPKLRMGFFFIYVNNLNSSSH
jgi:hypothetical protein